MFPRYSTFINFEGYENETVFNGVIIDKKSNKWLTNESSGEVNECLNYDEFNIIDNENDIKQLEEIYEAVKNNSFKVNEYTPPMDELSTFVTMSLSLWLISTTSLNLLLRKYICRLNDHLDMS